MSILIELIARRTDLEEKIKALTQTQRTEAIAKVRALMEDNGLSLADLGSKAKFANKLTTKPTNTSEKGKAKIPQKVAAKYRDHAGNTWSGRGLQPRWLKLAIEAGKKIQDFAI